MRQWTDLQREQAATRARIQRPWRYSTGPRTAIGKEKSSRNAYKHGRFSYEKQVLRWYLRFAIMRNNLIKCELIHQEHLHAEFSRQRTKEWKDRIAKQGNELIAPKPKQRRKALRLPKYYLKNGKLLKRYAPPDHHKGYS